MYNTRLVDFRYCVFSIFSRKCFSHKNAFSFEVLYLQTIYSIKINVDSCWQHWTKWKLLIPINICNIHAFKVKNRREFEVFINSYLSWTTERSLSTWNALKIIEFQDYATNILMCTIFISIYFQNDILNEANSKHEERIVQIQRK